MRCINSSDKSYTGEENTPLGLGYSASVEKVGTKMTGRDGDSYVVKKYKNGKRWVLGKKTNQKGFLDWAKKKLGGKSKLIFSKIDVEDLGKKIMGEYHDKLVGSEPDDLENIIEIAEKFLVIPVDNIPTPDRVYKTGDTLDQKTISGLYLLTDRICNEQFAIIITDESTGYSVNLIPENDLKSDCSDHIDLVATLLSYYRDEKDFKMYNIFRELYYFYAGEKDGRWGDIEYDNTNGWNLPFTHKGKLPVNTMEKLREDRSSYYIPDYVPPVSETSSVDSSGNLGNSRSKKVPRVSRVRHNYTDHDPSQFTAPSRMSSPPEDTYLSYDDIGLPNVPSQFTAPSRMSSPPEDTYLSYDDIGLPNVPSQFTAPSWMSSPPVDIFPLSSGSSQHDSPRTSQSRTNKYDMSKLIDYDEEDESQTSSFNKNSANYIGMENLIKKQKENFNNILVSLDNVDSIKSWDWLWWVFPNDDPSDDEETNPTWVIPELIPTLLENTDVDTWIKILLTIFQLHQNVSRSKEYYKIRKFADESDRIKKFIDEFLSDDVSVDIAEKYKYFFDAVIKLTRLGF